MPEAPAPAAATCPRCGFAAGAAAECARCGVILARARPAADRRAGRAHGAPASRGRRFTWVDAALVLALLAGGGGLAKWRHDARRAAVAPTAPARLTPAAGVERAAPAASEPAGQEVADLLARVEPPAPSLPAPVLPAAADPGGLTADDQKVLGRLGQVAHGRGAVENADVFAAEDLFRRYPRHAAVGQVARAVLQAAAEAEAGQGRTAEGLRLLARVADLWPEAQEPWFLLISGHLESRQYREAELAARRALSAHPAATTFHQQLAAALIRQERQEEALQVLRSALAMSDSPGLRAMAEQLERALAHERELASRTSLHFTVHVERGASDVRAREVLALLERKYDELARTLNYEPATEIPVVIFPTADGMAASGAPAWAAGTYSHADGRIRIGTADLSRGITPGLEETLVHELVHAFVGGQAQNNVPRAINEGLAQYLSGQRPRPVVINTGTLTGRGGSVYEFYEAALSFVDYLLRRHGQGAMNDLLSGLGKGGGEAAFRRAYGSSYEELLQDWVKQLT